MNNKEMQRDQARLVRLRQIDKLAVSERICRRVLALPEYQQALTVMWYVSCRSEVSTLDALAAQTMTNKTVVVPYCTRDNQGQNALGLWRIENLAELTPGCWNILEPPLERRAALNRQVDAREIEVIIVPGVAFDRQGGRLGNGAGYYDRLLQSVSSQTRLIGICFEAQIVDKVIMETHDVRMHNVVTEQQIYSGGAA